MCGRAYVAHALVWPIALPQPPEFPDPGAVLLCDNVRFPSGRSSHGPLPSSSFLDGQGVFFSDHHHPPPPPPLVAAPILLAATIGSSLYLHHCSSTHCFPLPLLPRDGFFFWCLRKCFARSTTRFATKHAPLFTSLASTPTTSPCRHHADASRPFPRRYRICLPPHRERVPSSHTLLPSSLSSSTCSSPKPS